MRKLITAIVLLASVGIFSSCFEEQPIGMQTILINVTEASWNKTKADNNNYFYATVDVPELTEDIFDAGLVKMYRTFDFDRKNASQMELPYTWQYEYNTGVKDKEGKDIWEFYSEHISYEFNIGSVSIYYTVSDFNYELDSKWSPEAMQFRLVLM